jgi:prepilin-type N-terminal cleavage/methylation domain-containing protein
MKLRHLHPEQTARRGFSLLEMIVAITIMVVLVGVAVPVSSKVMLYKARMGTNQELQTLADAALDHFRDTWVLPANSEDLLVDAGSTPGWSGPYLPGVVADRLTGLSGYQVDAWSRPYDFSASGDILTISSQGQDAESPSEHDLEIRVDVTPVRRQETIARLETINQAITTYNRLYLPDQPLPASYSAAYSRLVGAGLLPSSSRYSADGWGDSYLPDPPGATPVVRATSANLATPASSSTGSGSGNSSGSGSSSGGNGKSQKNGNGKGNAKGKGKS